MEHIITLTPLKDRQLSASCECGWSPDNDNSLSVLADVWDHIDETEPKVKWVDLLGIDPNFTGGKPVREFLEESRGEA